MHQAQFVKARAESLTSALALFGEHITHHGGTDNWWTRLGALELPSGTIHVPPPPSLSPARDASKSALVEAEKDQIRRFEADFQRRYSTDEAWRRAPWTGILSNCELAGVPWMSFGDKMADEERRTLARIRKMSPSKIPAWFLETALIALRQRYTETSIPPDPKIDGLGSRRRRELAFAFERIYEATYGLMEDKDDVPYLRWLSPYDWPAHLVGKDGEVFYIMVDMHL